MDESTCEDLFKGIATKTTRVIKEVGQARLEKEVTLDKIAVLTERKRNGFPTLKEITTTISHAPGRPSLSKSLNPNLSNSSE